MFEDSRLANDLGMDISALVREFSKDNPLYTNII
jgi:hypothetical protein